MVTRMRNRTATWVHMIFALIIVLAVPLQVYFIASYFSGAGEGALDAHGFTGGIVIHGSELIVFLSSLVAFWGFWRWVGWSFGLFVLGTVQIFLSPPEDIEDRASGWVHGLHGLGALLVFLLAAWLAYRDARLLGLIRPRADTAPVAGPPPQPPA
jgi:hypothetical protein